MIDEFAIPKDRVAVAIGPNGGTKKNIEKETRTTIRIDSKNGDVEIEAEDAAQVLKAANIVRAIGRGFSPEHAMKLAQDDYYLEIINLTEFLGKHHKAIQSKKGRIIGKEGSIRETIEKDTQTFISVYGKTVGIIGKADNVEKAIQAITMLVKGAEHATVLNYLRQSLTTSEEFEFR
ncbi:MAG: RNA-processing protein [Candidatus Diapherotrites archaeon]|uniref:RNA-processing protein n=1 Tax=Candidatus Iainarchaeum sp. TaxID=3101447 RepID=A0A8T4C7K9_9ARCH|nr:RNA-processing protein [Candidatus Diapherotrites archaeon]